jgi:hypothetical protein
VRVAAVIPAWNEAGSLGPLLDELAALPPGTLERVIVADGGSTDSTPDVARSRGAHVVTQRRRGYGGACLEGFLAARAGHATHVVFLDGDGSDPPTAIPALVRPILEDTADLALGARQPPTGGADPMAWHARIGNALVCAIIRLRAGCSVTDLPSMKAVSVATLDSLSMQELGFGWTTELIAKALQRGLRVQEVPIPVRARTAGSSKVTGSVRNSARAAVALIRTAWTYSH